MFTYCTGVFSQTADWPQNRTTRAAPLGFARSNVAHRCLPRRSSDILTCTGEAEATGVLNGYLRERPRSRSQSGLAPNSSREPQRRELVSRKRGKSQRLGHRASWQKSIRLRVRTHHGSDPAANGGLPRLLENTCHSQIDPFVGGSPLARGISALRWLVVASSPVSASTPSYPSAGDAFIEGLSFGFVDGFVRNRFTSIGGDLPRARSYT